MIKHIKLFTIITGVLSLLAAGAWGQETDALYQTLKAKDSLLFDIAFHSCKVQQLHEIFSPAFVFYHDNGSDGPTGAQSLANFTDNIQRRCSSHTPKMRREIVGNSLQVIPVNNQEAIQTGIQRLYVLPEQGGEQLVEESKFTRNWKKQGNDWKMVSELDYAVKTSFPDPGQARYVPNPFVPSREPLYGVIAQQDSLFFHAYNNCDMKTMTNTFSDSLEFYHDVTGLSASKKEVLASTKKNICGKVTRELVPGSLEVYPIHGYGAVEIAYHRFHNNQQPVGTPSKASKFIVLWKNTDSHWQISRVISLH